MLNNQVALLAEGVGRNAEMRFVDGKEMPSPSSRRAWVEMMAAAVTVYNDTQVALLAEGVGRNMDSGDPAEPGEKGRPPRGGRG